MVPSPSTESTSTVPLVPLHDGLHEREPEAGALDLVGHGERGAEEPGEQPLLLGGRDADAGVGDAQHDVVAVGAAGGPSPARRRG